MANTAELTIVLKADGSGLTGTVRVSAEEVRKLGKELDETGGKATKAGRELKGAGNEAERFGKAAGAAAAAAAVGFAMLVKNSIDAAANIHTLSQRTGTSAELLSSLGAAARRNDTDLRAMVGGLDALGDAAVRAAAGGRGAREFVAAFATIGVEVKDANGQIKETPQLLEDVARGLTAIGPGALQSRTATQLLGESGKDLLLALRELSDVGLQGVIDKARETGQVISSEAAAQAHAFNDDVQSLRDNVGTLGQGIAQDLLPTLLALSGMLVTGTTSAADARTETSALRSMIENLGLAVVVTTETLRVLFTMLFAGVDAIGGVGDVVNGVVGNLTGIGKSIGAYLVGDLAESKAQFDAAGVALAEGWETGATRAANAWDQVLVVGDEADRKVAEYNQRIAAGYSQFGNVVGGVGPIIDETTASTEAQAEALRRLQAALTAASDGANKHAKEQRDTERSERARVAALTALDTIIGNLGGKLDPLAAAEDHHADALRQIAAESAKALKEGADYAVVQGKVAEATALAEAAHRREVAALKEKAGVAGAPDILKAVRDNAAYEQSLLRMTARQRAFTEAQKAAGEYFKQNEALFVAAGVGLDQYAEAQANAAVATFDVGQQAADLEAILSRFDNLDFGASLSGQLKLVQKALKEMLDLGPPTKEAMEQIERVNRALAALRKEQIHPNTTAFLDLGEAVVTGMKGAAEEGSRTMAALEIASAGIALTQGILAILTQGQGEPYSAFVRMAAMAALVIPLAAQAGAAISMAGGAGFSDTAAERQAAQGTGTVLGDSEAKSESIANAIEITADATSTLVGLNRGMLSALLALKDALSAAGVLLARGAGDADFSGFDLAVDGAGSGLFDGKGILGRLLTGSSKVTDEGIIIFGGALTEMLESIAVGAYQEVQSRSWAFGSTHTNEAIVDVSDEFGRQFQLVIGSIVDTVREGALAIGLLPEEIEAALAAYRVEEIRISLKGLTAEEQQAELEAVFSALFDGLAGAVVPFIGQFQQVGEGLGETLVRIATEVQVAQEAFRQLGLAVDESDPERFAQIADGLVHATGGIEAFISGMQAFVAAFAGEGHQFQVASDALASAFAQVGLTVPDTRQGMWNLMQTLDATTEAGREQIATLLRLAEVADQYYDLLEGRATAQADYARYIADLGAEGSGISSVSSLAAARLEIDKWEQDAILRANELAQAAGLQGIAEQDLILIRQIAEDRLLQAIAMIEEASRELVDRLWGDASSASDASESASGSLRRFSGAIGDTARAAQSAAQLLLGALSPLNDQQKLQYAIGAYQRGTVSKEDVLQIGRRLYASSQAYEDLFNMLQGMPGGIREGGGGGSYAGDVAQQERGRTAAELEAEERRRHGDAQLLAQNVASLANIQHISYQQVADTLDFGLGQLASELGLSQGELTAYLDNLVAQENAVPNSIRDSTDRIVAALYDIAGLPAPADFARDNGGTSAEYPYRHSTRGNPYADAPPPPRSRGGGLANEGAGTRTEDRRTADGIERLIAETRRGNDEVVTAVRDNVRATRDVDGAIRDRRNAGQAGRTRGNRTRTVAGVRQ